MTASFGAALGTEAATSIELLALADSRLLSAKRNGRNRVTGPGPRPEFTSAATGVSGPV